MLDLDHILAEMIEAGNKILNSEHQNLRLVYLFEI
jgi:hypothetical protein